MKNKVYSIINILGLSIGLATSIIIAIYIANDLSYDSHHTKADRIALFQQFPNSSSSGSSFSELLSKRAGVETTTQISPNRALISNQKLAAYEPNFCLVDSSLTKVFDFPMQSGAINEAINQPNKIVLSERMAIKYFANKNPIGQTIDVQLTNKIPCTVVGIFKNIPNNSHLKIEFIASSKNTKQLLNTETKTYWDFAGMTYILFNKKDSFEKFTTQLPAIQKATNDQNSQAWKLSIIPLRDIYLKNRTDDRIKATNAIEFVRIFSAIAVCILLLACFNYINLGLARATLRAKEVGVRKVIGAARKQLIGQFLSESFLFTCISVLIALVIIQLGIPYINIFFDKHLSTLRFSEPLYLSYLLIFVVLISLFTGIYPAFALSSYKPIQVLKNYINPKSSLSLFRRSMVVFQFTISIAILVATIVVMNQLRYLQTKDLGYNREQILTLQAPEQSTENQKNILENELSKLTDVKEVTRVSILPGNGIGFNKLSPLSLKNNQMDPTIGQIYVDDKFLRVFDVKLLEGRFFNNNSAADGQNYIVNKEAIKKFGWHMGQTIGYMKYEYSPTGGYVEVPVNGQIIGIIDDYNQMDLKSPIFPIMMIKGNGWGQYAIKLNNKDYKSTISKIGTIWKKQFVGYPFEYTFLDDEFNNTYKKERQTSQILSFFSGLAIFITSLGLFGMITFMAEQRQKEIGIRKVLGASINSIVRLLSKDFLKLIFISILIASPLAYYFMDKWLTDFAYKTNISWWIFALSGVLSIVIALLTVSYQAIKAALMNPVKSLKTE